MNAALDIAIDQVLDLHEANAELREALCMLLAEVSQTARHDGPLDPKFACPTMAHAYSYGQRVLRDVGGAGAPRRLNAIAIIERLLSWVDGLPVKHPQQAEARDAAHALIKRVRGEQ